MSKLIELHAPDADSSLILADPSKISLVRLCGLGCEVTVDGVRVNVKESVDEVRQIIENSGSDKGDS